VDIIGRKNSPKPAAFFLTLSVLFRCGDFLKKKMIFRQKFFFHFALAQFADKLSR